MARDKKGENIRFYVFKKGENEQQRFGESLILQPYNNNNSIKMVLDMIPQYKINEMKQTCYQHLKVVINFSREDDPTIQKRTQSIFRSSKRAKIENVLEGRNDENDDKNIFEPRLDEPWPHQNLIAHHFNSKPLTKTDIEMIKQKCLESKLDQFETYIGLQTGQYQNLQKALKQTSLKNFFTSAMLQHFLDAPRMIFSNKVIQNFKIGGFQEACDFNTTLQGIILQCLKMYSIRNASNGYIQCMGSQMKQFVEDAFLNQSSLYTNDKIKDLEWLELMKDDIAEEAFWQFVWFHEVILPIGFYNNTIQIQVLSQITLQLIAIIDKNLSEYLQEDLESFINNQMLTLFITFEDRRLREKILKILFKHGGQSTSRMFKHLTKKQQNNIPDTSRLLICIAIVMIQHFKEEARKDQIEASTPEYRCMSDEYKSNTESSTFEQLVLSSVKLERLEFDVLFLEQLIFQDWDGIIPTCKTKIDMLKKTFRSEGQEGKWFFANKDVAPLSQYEHKFPGRTKSLNIEKQPEDMQPETWQTRTKVEFIGQTIETIYRPTERYIITGVNCEESPASKKIEFEGTEISTQTLSNFEKDTKQLKCSLQDLYELKYDQTLQWPNSQPVFMVQYPNDKTGYIPPELCIIEGTQNADIPQGQYIVNEMYSDLLNKRMQTVQQNQTPQYKQMLAKLPITRHTESIQTVEKQLTTQSTREKPKGQFDNTRRNIVDLYKFGYRFSVQQGLIKLLENHKQSIEQEQLIKLISYGVVKACERSSAKGSARLNQFVVAVLNNYKCSGPGNAPVCLYDFTTLNVTCETYVFSALVKESTTVQLERATPKSGGHQDIMSLTISSEIGTQEQKMDQQQKENKPSKLVKGVSMLDKLDINWLNNIKVSLQPVQHQQQLSQEPLVSHGHHLCKDSEFIEAYHNEHKIAMKSSTGLPHDQKDLGSLFSSKSYFDKAYYGVQENQERALIGFMDDVKDQRQSLKYKIAEGEEAEKEKELLFGKIDLKATETDNNRNLSGPFVQSCLIQNTEIDGIIHAVGLSEVHEGSQSYNSGDQIVTEQIENLALKEEEEDESMHFEQK